MFGPGSLVWHHLAENADLIISLDRPFAYYPARGNLLLDVRTATFVRDDAQAGERNGVQTGEQAAGAPAGPHGETS